MNMSNRIWEKDGLSREKYTDRGAKGQKVEVLESDALTLLARVVEIGAGIPYFDSDNREDGTWKQMWWWEPLVVLAQLKMLDVAQLEKNAAVSGSGSLEPVSADLQQRVKGWAERLEWCDAAGLKDDLRAIVEQSSGSSGLFYGLLAGIRRVQDNYEKYLEEIEKQGRMDPALALLLVFVRNLGRVAGRFNDRWQGLADLYLEQVLHARPRGVQPDRVWLAFDKDAGTEDVVLKKGTGFMAECREGGVPLCYRSDEDCPVGEMRPGKMVSLFLESDPVLEPAATMGFTTAIWRKEFDLENMEGGQQLFGGDGARFISVGLVVESPMLLLGDGKRTVSLSFYLTAESVGWLRGITEMCEVWRLLADAFYLEASTEGGWTKITDYVLNFREEECLEFTFKLYDEFPAVIPCRSDVHRADTRMPALRILLNRDAWLFPYSWTKRMLFYKMKINARVEGSRKIKIYNELGEVDANMPFYPFGVQPERGNWMVFGSYELALKPVVKAGLTCRWMGLSRDPGGLAGYYAAYGEAVKNDSFRIRTEWLKDGKWEGAEESGRSLFTVGDEGVVDDTGYIICEPEKRMPPVRPGEQEYEWGRSGNGFMRVVFTAPEMGFGHKLYRRLFAEIMMRNSRRKKQLPVPAEPLSPQVDNLLLDYEAEEELLFKAGQVPGVTCLYHISPSVYDDMAPVPTNEPVRFVEGADNKFILSLGFKGAAGYNRLRFFIDFAPYLVESIPDAPLPEEGETAYPDVPVRHSSWSVFRAVGWASLPAVAVLRDDTEGFMRSGLIEIELPDVVTETDIRTDRLFWLRGEFSGTKNSFPTIRGIYMNVVEAVGEKGGKVGGIPLGTVWKTEKNLPGIASVVQAATGSGGKGAESKEDMALRLATRIAGRGRVVTAGDYERAVLEHFPQVAKVKCLPAVDVKGWKRRGVVTVVVMQKRETGEMPMCTNSLLLEVEERLGRLATRFAIIDVINPVYEEMTVRCRLVLMPGNVPGVVIKRLADKLNRIIAPWLAAGEMPEFGYGFSLQAVRNVLLEDAGVARLIGLSVLHVTPEKERVYRLNEYIPDVENEVTVKASAPWCVAIPAANHLIGLAGDWQERAGVGELEIGKTMIIGAAGNE